MELGINGSIFEKRCEDFKGALLHKSWVRDTWKFASTITLLSMKIFPNSKNVASMTAFWCNVSLIILIFQSTTSNLSTDVAFTLKLFHSQILQQVMDQKSRTKLGKAISLYPNLDHILGPNGNALTPIIGIFGENVSASYSQMALLNDCINH